jgi:hypothetical protein
MWRTYDCPGPFIDDDSDTNAAVKEEAGIKDILGYRFLLYALSFLLLLSLCIRKIKKKKHCTACLRVFETKTEVKYDCLAFSS